MPRVVVREHGAAAVATIDLPHKRNTLAPEDTAESAAAVRAIAQTVALLAALAPHGLARPLKWPTTEYFRGCANYQGQFIGSQEFRDLARRLLSGRAAVSG